MRGTTNPKASTAVAGRLDPLVLRFLGAKRKLHGDAHAEATQIRKEHGFYYVRLPCKNLELTGEQKWTKRQLIMFTHDMEKALKC